MTSRQQQQERLVAKMAKLPPFRSPHECVCGPCTEKVQKRGEVCGDCAEHVGCASIGCYYPETNDNNSEYCEMHSEMECEEGEEFDPFACEGYIPYSDICPLPVDDDYDDECYCGGCENRRSYNEAMWERN